MLMTILVTSDEGADTAVAEADNANNLAVQTDANNTKHLMVIMLLMMLAVSPSQLSFTCLALKSPWLLLL